MLKDCYGNLKGKMQIVGLFYVVNDDKLVDGKVPQVMRCHLYCCKTFVLYNPRTKLRKGLISYYKTIGISSLKKHVDAKHGLFAKKLDEEVNNEVRIEVERQPTKKRLNVSSFEIYEFVFAKFPYKKDEMQ